MRHTNFHMLMVACGWIGSVSAHAADPRESAAPSSSLTEIVVTAERRSENLQDVPISITVVSGEELAALGVLNARDLPLAVPNLAYYNNTNTSPNIIVRGISSDAPNVGFDSSLGVYIDGVFMGRTSAFTTSLFDAQQVEVLRGPQGTLFGKNTTSGAISIETRQAGPQEQGDVSVEAGNYGAIRESVLLSGPITENWFGKIAAFDSKRDGYVRNEGPGPSTFSGEDSKGAAAQLRYRPNDAWDISLRGDFEWDKTRDLDWKVVGTTDPNGAPILGTGLGYVPGNLNVDLNSPGLERREVGGMSLTVVHGTEAVGQLTSISAYRRLQLVVDDEDIDESPLDLLTQGGPETLDQVSQELRYATPSGKDVSGVVGLYYFHQRLGESSAIGTGTDFPLPGQSLTTTAHILTSSYAAFGNVEYRFAPKWSVTAGARFTHERKELNFSQAGLTELGFPDVPPSAGSLSNSDVSPTVGLNFKPDEAWLLYLRVTEGYKSGGWNAELVTSTPNGTPFAVPDIVFRPEHIINYEAGSKATFFDGHARVNFAVFDEEYRDIQVTQFIVDEYITTNAGLARSRGFELESTANVLGGLDASLGVGYADAKYIQFLNSAGPGTNCDGCRLNAPKLTLNSSTLYRHPLATGVDWVSEVDYIYRSSRPGDGIDPFSATGNLYSLNSHVGIELSNGFRAYLWGQNLTNKLADLQSGTITNLAALGITQLGKVYSAPRMYGIRLGYRF